ncbi:Ribonuclease J [Paenibacillus allorhizosphaerae]|uniref:Ribonuclease J n=1 Tax=Paenibacillus allorhizosphaerae TaxID=2849866 RepID=A0ABN7TJ67_9BACL|nr:Ribonuclease J [Paenibacillus allorhizosphaerae]
MATERITFFGGLETTGGVHLLYGKGDTGVLFDCGIAHKDLIDVSGVFTFNPVRATPGREVRQYVLGRMAPPLPQLYVEEQAATIQASDIGSVWNFRDIPKYGRIGIFVGHMHQDHMALLPYLREGIAVYMSHDAYALYRGMVASGEYADTRATIVPLDDLAVVDFGEFRFQIVEMDHNTVGASGYIIESSDHCVAFTGDWRRHGRHPERIDRFIRMCREKKVDLLITEATKVPAEPGAQPKPPRPEADVLAQFAQVLADAKGMVYAQLLSRDLERIADFIQLAASAGRQAVMDARLAALWHEGAVQGVRVLSNHPAAASPEAVQVLDMTSTEYTLPYASVSLEQLIERKLDYVYFISYPNIAHLIELESLGDTGVPSHYVHADHPVNPGNSTIGKIISTYGIVHHAIGNGGHASAADVSSLIEQIAPKTVIPLHSWYPKRLDTRGVPAYFPERGETAAVADLIGAWTRPSAQEPLKP